MQVFNQKGLETFRKTPPFEHPSHFDENGNNTYYKNKSVTYCNWVFNVEEDFLYANAENSVAFNNSMELVFEENKNNLHNRQYLELEDGRYADTPAVFTYSFGDSFRGSKIVNIYDYNEFILHLRDNNKNNIADKLEDNG